MGGAANSVKTLGAEVIFDPSSEFRELGPSGLQPIQRGTTRVENRPLVSPILQAREGLKKLAVEVRPGQIRRRSWARPDSALPTGLAGRHFQHGRLQPDSVAGDARGFSGTVDQRPESSERPAEASGR